MDRLQQLQIFVAVADAGSFAKAAARLRRSPPTVTRAVSALERRLGARVFNRTTRNLAITEVGLRLLEAARRVLADLDAAEQSAAGAMAAPSGRLMITASVTFGRSTLAPVVCEFLDRYPRVKATMVLVDRLVNLVEEGVDVAVRIGDLRDSTLIAKRIGAVQRILVASPEYLTARGAPSSPSDLRHHSIIAFTGLMRNQEWRFQQGRKSGSVTLQPKLEVNDAGAAVQAAEHGHGITIALSYMVAEQVRAGSLVPVLGSIAPPPQPVHLVYPHSRLVAPSIRAFIDHAAPRLRDALANSADVMKAAGFRPTPGIE